MKKAFECKVGDKVIYRDGYDIVESVRVKEPIDDLKRPNFKIGRIDLANGAYLIGGEKVYESMEEAEKDILEVIECEIERQETIKVIADGMIVMLKNKLKKYKKK
jgi:hypothetical protein